MKKLFFYAATMASAFFAASCQQELLDPQAEGTTVTYTVEVPEVIATKAIGDEITDVDKVYFEVYRAADVVDLTKAPVYSGVNPVINRLASFSLEFVKNQEFVVLFWAQDEDLVYDATDNPTGMYDIDDLRQIQLVNPGAANNAAAQVFAGKDTVSDCVSAAKGKVTLKRPVSQINVYTTTESLSFGNVTIGLDKSSMTVAGLYNTFNVATGSPVELKANEARFEYTEAAVPNVEADNTAYTYVAMNYVGFASQTGTTATVDFTIWTTTEAEPIEHTVSNVPVKPNYRTNILGNLLTSDVKYNVELDQDWGPAGDVDDDYVVEVVSVASAEDLQEAIENIQDGAEGNIKLEGNIDLGALFAASTQAVVKSGNAALPIVISEEKTMTLDLNGFTITTPWEIETDGKHYYAFDNKGTLKIVDSKATGKIVARGIFNYGHMTLESGTIEACDGNGGYGVRNYVGAEFVMNGGTVATLYEDGDIPGEGYDACPIRVDEGAKAEINGGIINNVSNFTVAIDNYGETIVNDGTFTTVHTTLANSAVMTINGGSFTCNGLEGVTAHALWAADGTTTINGGTFDGKDNYNGFNVDASEGATVYIKGGEFLSVHSGSLYGEGTIIVTGGTFFDQVPAKYLAAGYSCQQNEEGKWIVPQVALAKIGDDLYPTLAAAIDAVSGDAPATITVQAAIFTDESIVIPAGKSITLDLNGMTITAAGEDGYAIMNEANLTIIDSKNNGVINGIVYGGGESANTTINGGTYNALDGGVYVLLNSKGTLTINNATINGGTDYPVYSYNEKNKLIINNVTINATFGCVNSYGTNGSVVINGGTFNMTGVQGKTSHIAYFSNVDAVINGGTFNKIGDINMSGTGGGGICAIYGAELTINNGTFAGDYADVYNWSGTNANGRAVSIAIMGGTYNFQPNKNFLADGYKSVQNADGKWEVEAKTYVAQIGEQQYESLQDAVDVVQNGETITLINNVTVSETSDPNGNVVYYTGDKSFTIDLNGKELKGNTSNVIFRFQKSEGAENTITIMNGTVEALENCWSAISIGSSASTKTKVNLSNLTVKSQKANDMAVRARSGAEFTMTNCIVVATESAGGICAGGGNVTLNNVTVNQTGWHSSNWNSVALGISGGGKMTVNSGAYTSNPNGDAHGTWVAYVMTSGGTLEINGGTFNGTPAENANSANACGLICADTKAVVNINDGEFNSTGAILDMRNNSGGTNPQAVLAGGNFSADPCISGLYGSNLIIVADGKSAVEGVDGRWTIQ